MAKVGVGKKKTKIQRLDAWFGVKVPVSKDTALAAKLVDFGYSRYRDRDALMRTECGTWSFAAPEVRGKETVGPRNYTAKCDCWSLGVILFMLLSGFHPFDPICECTDEDMWANACKAQYDFKDAARPLTHLFYCPARTVPEATNPLLRGAFVQTYASRWLAPPHVLAFC